MNDQELAKAHFNKYWVDEGEAHRPDDLVSKPPIPCDFKLGDEVLYTNIFGSTFKLTVRGFASTPHTQDDDPRFIYVCKDAWWYPVSASSLSKPQDLSAQTIEIEGAGTW